MGIGKKRRRERELRRLPNLNPVNIRKILHKLQKSLHKKKIHNILLMVILEQKKVEANWNYTNESFHFFFFYYKQKILFVNNIFMKFLLEKLGAQNYFECIILQGM